MKRRSRNLDVVGVGALILAASAFCGALFGIPLHDAALAQRGGLRATVYVTQTALARTLSERALLGFARGHQSRIMDETREENLAERHWNGNLVIAFSAPPGDMEFHGIFYDITTGTQTFVDDMSIYVSDRNQRTYVQRLNLQRPRFRPNKRMELVVTVRRNEVGRVRFDLRGEEPRRTGQVDFSVEDTRAQK